MNKILLNTQWIMLDRNKMLILKNYLEKPYIWTYVYTKENDKETYVGFYGNCKEMKEYIKYNKDYIAFCFINKYANHSEFIKKIYDINNKKCLGYNEYPEFKEKYGKALKLRK